MGGFYLYTSNRLENLAEKLAELLRASPLSPLQQEIVVVQSKGMQRWLNLEIARHNGISANLAYPFPKAFVYRLFREMIDLPAESGFSPEVMTWKIMELLPALVDEKDFKPLNAYLEGDDAELRRFQLAGKIADVFDQYIVYRPDMILHWDSSEYPLTHLSARASAEDGVSKDALWQSILWQRMTAKEKNSHLPLHNARLKQLFLENNDVSLNLPGRISIFGISSLPPFYIEIFSVLSERIDVNFFYLNPCRQYWEYIYTEKQIARRIGQKLPEEDEHYEKGNSLLASMGLTGRDFFNLILNLTGGNGEEMFHDPGQDTLLAWLQSDILNLRNSSSESPSEPPLQEDDLTVQIHSCHSPMREVEVLYENLLSLFDKKGDLLPKDIIVMMPDVSLYAPLIQAVFDAPEEEAKRIPYSIADTNIRQNSSVADTFMAILDLDRERFRAAAVLDIFENEAVYRHFDLRSEDLGFIRRWVKETGICWGIDGPYRQQQGLPGFDENSWRFGLDRMLLGYALPEEAYRAPFEGILPYGDIEGDHVRILGAFSRFAHALFAAVTSLNRHRRLSQWAELLSDMLTAFFTNDQFYQSHLQAIREALFEKGLAGAERLADYDKKVSLHIIRAFLKDKLEGEKQGHGFISSGVTFCTLLPMRSIPFRVVYVLGMNDGDYPRREQRAGFDLMEQDRRPGDRSKRHEDRYLFLESILSARENFIISYVGQNIKDNSERPPSVLVSELCDYIKAAFKLEEGEDILQHIVCRHPLQPFSPEYFQDSGKFASYSRQNFLAARKLFEGEHAADDFISASLPPARADEWKIVSIEQLYHFFALPAEFLFRHRLYIDLRLSDASAPGDREPFHLDNLQQYLIRQVLVDYHIQHQDPEVCRRSVKASGVLPHGQGGFAEYRKVEQDVRRFYEKIAPSLSGGPLPPLEIELTFNASAYRLRAGLSNLYPGGQVFVRPANIRAKDLLHAWIHHLALNAIEDYEGEKKTVFYGRDKKIRFSPMPPSGAYKHLASLADYFFYGLTRPLHFAPETSYAFAGTILERNGDEPAALANAQKKWDGGYNYNGEGENPYLKKSFDGHMMESPLFRDTALRIFEPLFAYLEEE